MPASGFMFCAALCSARPRLASFFPQIMRLLALQKPILPHSKDRFSSAKPPFSCAKPGISSAKPPCVTARLASAAANSTFSSAKFKSHQQNPILQPLFPKLHVQNRPFQLQKRLSVLRANHMVRLRKASQVWKCSTTHLGWKKGPGTTIAWEFDRVM